MHFLNLSLNLCLIFNALIERSYKKSKKHKKKSKKRRHKSVSIFWFWGFRIHLALFLKGRLHVAQLYPASWQLRWAHWKLTVSRLLTLPSVQPCSILLFYFIQDSPESDVDREKDKKERENEKERSRQRSESKHKSPPKKRPGKDSVSLLGFIYFTVWQRESVVFLHLQLCKPHRWLVQTFCISVLKNKQNLCSDLWFIISEYYGLVRAA